MNLMNEDPNPKSSSVKELMRTLRTTQTPKSFTERCDRMYGVSRIVTRKLHDRPMKLKNVLVTSFFEKSPRKVIEASVGTESDLIMPFDGQRGNPFSCRLSRRGDLTGACRFGVIVIPAEEMIAD